MAMNRPSLDKYEGIVKSGGLLVVNGSMVDRPVKRTDIDGDGAASQRDCRTDRR